MGVSNYNSIMLSEPIAKPLGEPLCHWESGKVLVFILVFMNGWWRCQLSDHKSSLQLYLDNDWHDRFKIHK